MMLCCLIPIGGLVSLNVFDVQLAWLKIAFALACPVGMFFMFIRKSKKGGHGCCKGHDEDDH